MKMPIPSDWDGLSTCDFMVTWPDSAIWRFILRGLLTNPGLNEFWDQSTGDIAQLTANFQPIMISALDNLECGAMQIPIGAILEFAGSILPDKFLWADGSSVSITAYQELYFAIGDTYHPGGIGVPENFYLPDRRGRVGVGKDASQAEFDVLGEKGGQKNVTLTISQIPSHDHTVYGNVIGGTGTVRRALAGSSGNDVLSSSTGGGQSHNNLQPYLVCNYIIRALK